MVKGQTQKGHRPPLSSNPKHSNNENSLKKQALGEPYAVHVRCTLLFTRTPSHFACAMGCLGCATKREFSLACLALATPDTLEFRPSVGTQSLVSPVSLPYRGNISRFDGVLGRPVCVLWFGAFWFCCFVWVAVFSLCSGVLPHHHVVFPLFQ